MAQLGWVAMVCLVLHLWVERNGIANVIEEQLNYTANDKSNWYYDSIPGLSTWQKYVVM